MMNCTYTKTLSGTCEQSVVAENFSLSGEAVCYYHDKVKAGLIEADEVQSLNDMPKIAEII